MELGHRERRGFVEALGQAGRHHFHAGLFKAELVAPIGEARQQQAPRDAKPHERCFTVARFDAFRGDRDRLTERVRAEANRRAERRLVCSLYLCGLRRRLHDMLVCRLADDLLQRLPHCMNTVRQAAELPLLCRYFLSVISAARRQPSSSPMF